MNGDSAVPWPREWYSITRVKAAFLYEVSECSAWRAVDWWTSADHADHTSVLDALKLIKGYTQGTWALHQSKGARSGAHSLARTGDSRCPVERKKRKKEKKKKSLDYHRRVPSVEIMKTHEKLLHDFITLGTWMVHEEP